MPDTPPPPDFTADRLFPLVHRELREIAAAHLRNERANHTLQPTALVHEAYLRMQGKQAEGFRDREHFLAVASVAMRRVLVDHARARQALKRGGGALRVTADEASAIAPDRTEDVLSVDQALSRLASEDQVAARVVEMRFFAGMTEPEVATTLGRSERWVRLQWAFARAWLRRAMDTGC